MRGERHRRGARSGPGALGNGPPDCWASARAPCGGDPVWTDTGAHERAAQGEGAHRLEEHQADQCARAPGFARVGRDHAISQRRQGKSPEPQDRVKLEITM